MISEGVDIPRAACLAWMTAYRTPLFFAQAVGRVVRAAGAAESATVFLPAVRPLLALAAELEHDRNYVMAPPQTGRRTIWTPRAAAAKEQDEDGLQQGRPSRPTPVRARAARRHRSHR